MAARERQSDEPEDRIGTDVWHTAHELARRARAAGVSVPATDLLIAAETRRPKHFDATPHRLHLMHLDDLAVAEPNDCFH